jgi:hypothetical protein
MSVVIHSYFGQLAFISCPAVYIGDMQRRLMVTKVLMLKSCEVFSIKLETYPPLADFQCSSEILALIFVSPSVFGLCWHFHAC